MNVLFCLVFLCNYEQFRKQRLHRLDATIRHRTSGMN